MLVAHDGTLKMFAYLVLLNDPYAHPLLCVEEPENQLDAYMKDGARMGELWKEGWFGRVVG